MEDRPITARFSQHEEGTRGHRPRPGVWTFAVGVGARNSPPWQRRGGRASSKYPRSFAKRGRGGSFNLPIVGGLNEPPRLRPAKEASQHFLNGRSHPSFSKEGNPPFRRYSRFVCVTMLRAKCEIRDVNSDSLVQDICKNVQTPGGGLMTAHDPEFEIVRGHRPRPGVWTFAVSVGRRNSPPWKRRGGRAIK